LPLHCHSDNRRTEREGPEGEPRTMKHVREQEDRGSGSSKSSLSASSDTSVSSAASKQQALRFAEDLSLPSVCTLSLPLPRNLVSPNCNKHYVKVLFKLSVLLRTLEKVFGGSSCISKGMLISPFHEFSSSSSCLVAFPMPLISAVSYLKSSE
jgi:hypothetical protein